jgi:DNA repair and recombination protein RAD52
VNFTDGQIAALKAPLNQDNVKQRSQAGRQLSYIEGWHAIAEANRIFGFDGWHRELVTLKELGEARQVGDKWRVAYMATVRIRVRVAGEVTIIRDGTGYGSGIDKDLGQAHESALKEAETDAMKRALMTFGNPFGLALYDKEQRNVEAPAKAGHGAISPAESVELMRAAVLGDTRGLTPAESRTLQQAGGIRPSSIGGHDPRLPLTRANLGLDAPKEDVAAYIGLAGKALEMAETAADVQDWWRDEAATRVKLGILNSSPAYNDLVELCRKRKAELTEKRAA